LKLLCNVIPFIQSNAAEYWISVYRFISSRNVPLFCFGMCSCQQQKKCPQITFISSKTRATFSCVSPPYLKYRKWRQSKPKQCQCTVISQTLDGAKQPCTAKYGTLLLAKSGDVEVEILYLLANYDGHASADICIHTFLNIKFV